MRESQLREAICRYGQTLYNRGLASGSAGNITLRLDDDRYLCTPTGISLGHLDPAQLSLIDRNQVHLDGPKPTKETPLHAALYRTRSDTGAIVHLHSVHSVAVSILPAIDPGEALPPLTAYYVMKVGRTVILPYFAPGDPAVARAIEELGGSYRSILLSNHGPVMAGKTLEEACSAIEELEETAKLHLLTVGKDPQMLTKDQIAQLAQRFSS